MLAAAVGVEARAEADIRAVVPGEGRQRMVWEKLRARQRLVEIVELLVALRRSADEAVRGLGYCAARWLLGLRG